MRPRRQGTWIAIVGLIVLTACSPGAPAATQAQESGEPAAAGGVPVQENAAPTLPETPAAPTLVPVKSGLEATDPATVELASGGPLLVEFFAFW
jgi:multidrug efflux pump subunit AcrA (membrane-fusion protein)